MENKGEMAAKPSINQEKIFALEMEIEAQWGQIDHTKKGCFGKLVRLAESEICKSCKDSAACAEAMLTDGKDQMIEAEAEIEAIVAENQLNAELVEMAAAKPKMAEINESPILQQIYEVANKALASLSKAEEPKAEEPKAEEPKAEEPKAEEPKAEEPKAEEPKADPIAQAMASKLEPQFEPLNVVVDIDLSYLGKGTKVAFDFNKAKDMILAEKPADFKRVRAICLSLVSDTFKHGATAYNNANKIMAVMQEKKILSWNAEAKRIEYAI